MQAKRPCVLCLTLIGIGTLWIGSILRPDPFLFYNPSASAPVGWYRILPERPIARGDLVAARLPVEAEVLASARGYLPGDIPVIKTVWALPGDRICMDDTTLQVSDRPPLPIRHQDLSGRPLTPWRHGCTRLRPDEVLILSNRIDESFDSRYFGPVRAGDIIGRVAFIGKLPIAIPPACARQDTCSLEIRSFLASPLLLTSPAPNTRAARPSRTWRHERAAG
ncbi:S26 family signal peptidase [Hyphomonas chukchiensis]|uniref:S26 family signal peptidase n=1 Tax=Hyphomonas chukchiensis TaxID=1280947 RepID=UPI003C6CD77F